MSITFGGLATGLDTNAIVDQLMALERQPITRLQTDRTWFESKQKAFAEFDGKLSGFLSSIEKLGSSDDLRQKAVSASSKDFFSVTAGVDALPGTSYQVEVASLAQVEKSVSEGYADKTAGIFGIGELALTVGTEDPLTIDIDGTNNSLEGIMAAINAADAGVSAAIINDGTASPYRLVLTGENVATSFSLTSTQPTFNGDLTTALTTGGYADAAADLFGAGTIDTSHGDVVISGANSLDDIVTAINGVDPANVEAEVVDDGNGGKRINMLKGSLDAVNLTGGTGAANFSFTETQPAAQAHIKVDDIDIYSDSNTLSEAIPGLTLSLTSAEVGIKTSVSVSLDEAAIAGQIESFVKGYNEVMSFISSQTANGEGSGGVLGSDAGVKAVKRRLQGLLTTLTGNSGSFAALSELGLKTQKNGTLELDKAVLSEAIQNDLDSVEKLLVGENGADGIAVQFQTYLEGMTDSTEGLLAANKKSTESTLRRIDSRIETIELRLEKKEETMRAKFTALEQLISGMNSQSSFLTQQMDMLSGMLTKGN